MIASFTFSVTAEQGSTGEGKIDGSIADDDTVKVSAQDYFKDANYVASDSMAKALMEVKSGTADVASFTFSVTSLPLRNAIPYSC